MAIRTVAEVFPPGEFIGEELEERGWSQVELAEIMGRPARLISELLSGKRSITPETAKGLGAAFGTGPELWMNLERDYQLSRATHDDSAVERRAKLYAKAPVKEMIKRRWIEPSENTDVLWQRVLDFLCIKDIDEQPSLAHASKKGTSYADVTSAQWAWIFRAKQIAQHISVSKYSRKSLSEAIGQLECLLIAPEEARHVPRVLTGCGVRFVIVEKLPNMRMDGICFWLDDYPVIAMSLSRDTIDNFWFVLRHEIEHVLRGDGKDYPMIDADLSGVKASTDESLPEEERAANAAAANFCAPVPKVQSFISRKHPFYYERDVLAFARLVNRHPGLIVGQMQFRMNNYSYLAKHLSKIRNVVIPGAIVDGYGQDAHIAG